MDRTIQKDYRIEYLRILTALMVSALHICGQGGLIESAKPGTSQFALIWLIEIVSYCAVNCFGLISGYLRYDERKPQWKFSSYIKTWIHVLYYSFLFTLIFKIIMPQSCGLRQIILSVFPVGSNAYWYFTAYTGMFFFSPLLKTGLQKMEEKTAGRLLFFMMIVPFYFVAAGHFSNIFTLEKGYSALWLIYLYLVGGLIRKTRISDLVQLRWILLMLIISNLFTWGMKIGFSLFNNHGLADILISYLSPTILLNAICWMLLFLKLKKVNAHSGLIAFFW